MKKKIILAILLTILAFFSISDEYFKPGMPFTHDGENHLVRFANYKQAVKEGQIPPRLAPTLFNRTGYPVFNYNYPLANIVSLPFSALKISYETTFKIISVSALALASAGLFYGVYRLTESSLAPVLLTVFYLSNPYLLNLLYVRGTIGELMAYSLMPFLALTIYLFVNVNLKNWWVKPVSVLVWSLFFLAHNSSVLLITPFVMLAAGLTFFKERKLGFEWFSTVLWAVLLTLWFWAPALWETKYVTITEVNLARQFIYHFPSVLQLFWSPITFGHSLEGSVDSMSFSLGLPFWLLFWINTVVLFFYRKEKKNLPVFIFFVASCVLTVLLQTNLSTMFWEITGLGAFVQFPWRLQGISIFSMLVITVLSWKYWSTFLKIILVVILAAHTITAAQVKPVDRFSKTTVDYDASTISSSTTNENKSRVYNAMFVSEYVPAPSIFEGEAEVEVVVWRPFYRQYLIRAQSPVIILEETMRFPGWTTVTNTGLAFSYDTYTDSGDISGRLAFPLSEGEHLVTTQFTQHTPVRLLSNAVSLAAVLALVIQTGLRWHKK